MQSRKAIEAAVSLAVVVIVLAGCGGMSTGAIYSANGRMIQFQIEKAHRTGAVLAFDPSSGERFTGTYIGIRQGATAYLPA